MSFENESMREVWTSEVQRGINNWFANIYLIALITSTWLVSYGQTKDGFISICNV